MRKRIVVLVSDAFGGRGGIAKFNRDLLWAICASPVVSQVVAIPRSMPDTTEGLPPKLRYDTGGIHGKAAFLLATWNAVREPVRSNLVLCGHINLLPIAWLAARITHAPLWCVIHGIDAWQPNRSWLVNRLLRNVDRVIAVSDATRQRFANWSEVPFEKIHLLPNCYDPSIFYPAPRNNLLVRRYGLDNKIVLMTVGRLVARERYKGFDEVIDILPALARELPNVVYLIAGDGDDKSRLQQKVINLGLQDRVVFTGYVDETEKVDTYRLADVYVMPSRGEGFGIVFLEAMACGIPAIGSKLDGSREALAGGRLGILVDPANRDEICDAIRASLNKEKGKPPAGLEEFSLSRFKDRVWELLEISAIPLRSNSNDD